MLCAGLEESTIAGDVLPTSICYTAMIFVGALDMSTQIQKLRKRHLQQKECMAILIKTRTVGKSSVVVPAVVVPEFEWFFKILFQTEDISLQKPSNTHRSLSFVYACVLHVLEDASRM